MTNKVFTLVDNKQQNKQDIINKLHSLLERVNNDEINTIAIVANMSDGNLYVDYRSEMPATMFIGALERVKFDILKNVEEV